MSTQAPVNGDPSGIVPGLERAFMDFEAVEDRLVEAMAVLLRSGDRERAWLHPGTLAMFRQYRAEEQQPVEPSTPLKTCELTRREVERADEAMRWVVDSVPAGIGRRILGVALMQLATGDRARIEWPAVRSRLGDDGKAMTTNAVRMRYNRAIAAIADRENARTLAG